MFGNTLFFTGQFKIKSINRASKPVLAGKTSLSLCPFSIENIFQAAMDKIVYFIPVIISSAQYRNPTSLKNT